MLITGTVLSKGLFSGWGGVRLGRSQLLTTDLSILFAVTNLQCYECQSAESMDHCIQNSKAVTCSSSEEDRCAKFTSELVMGDKKFMVYRKGCREAAACQKGKDFFMQECGDDDTCENLCCEKDLCNAGSFFTISFAIMYASVLTAIFFM